MDTTPTIIDDSPTSLIDKQLLKEAYLAGAQNVLEGAKKAAGL